jgi:hypothetical protein
MRPHLLYVRHAGHLEAAGPVEAQEGRAGVVRDAVLVDELVGLERVTAGAGSAGGPKIFTKYFIRPREKEATAAEKRGKYFPHNLNVL